MALASKHSPLPLHWLVIWAAVALAIFLVAFLARPKKKAAPLRTDSPVSAILSSPVSFQNFPASVRQAGDPLLVDLVYTGEDGTQDTRTYTIRVNAKTVIQSLKVTKNNETSNIALSALRIGNNVQVYSDKNVAEVREFTATKILRIDQ